MAILSYLLLTAPSANRLWNHYGEYKSAKVLFRCFCTSFLWYYNCVSAFLRAACFLLIVYYRHFFDIIEQRRPITLYYSDYVVILTTVFLVISFVSTECWINDQPCGQATEKLIYVFCRSVTLVESVLEVVVAKIKLTKLCKWFFNETMNLREYVWMFFCANCFFLLS